MILIAIVLLASLVYLWKQYKYSFWRRYNVPGPDPSFLVGNLGPVIFQKEHIGLLANDWYKKFRILPYVGYYKVFKPAIMVNDTELVKNILINDFGSFYSNDVSGSDDSQDIGSGNPFTQQDEQKWKTGRAAMAPLFSASKIKSLFPQMLKPCDKLVKYIDQHLKTDVDAKSVASKYSAENVTACLFSVEANCFEDPNSKFRKIGRKVFQASFWSGIRFTLLFYFPYIVELFAISIVADEVVDWIEKLVKDATESRQNKAVENLDMFQVLLNSQKKYNLSMKQLTGHTLGSFVDGYETSSTSMSFAMWHLARNPDIQERLYEDISEVLQRHGNEFSYEAINEMEYLNMVMQETMRLNTIILTMHRKCRKPYALPLLPGQQKPFVIQPGTPVLIPVYAIHHNPEFYPDPYVFNPLRFTEEERQNRPRCAYLPFGEGPRLCVGKNLGMMQFKFGIASIIKNFKILESPNCKPVDIDPRSPLLLQTVNRLLVRFERRC